MIPFCQNGEEVNTTTPEKIDTPVLDLLANLVRDADTRREEAEQKLREADNRARILSSLSLAATNQSFAEIFHIFKKEAEFFDSLSSDKAVSAELEKLRANAEAKARENAKRFAETFAAYCEKAQMPLDTTSRHPRYSFAGGFIRVEVDERRLQAIVSIRDGANDPRPLDVEPLAKLLRKEYDRLFDRPFDAERFLPGVRKAYTAVLREEKRSIGEEVPLRRVAHRLSKNWSNFRLDEFNIDLARAMKSGQPDKEGYRLHLGHTRDTRQGMLLHGFEGSGYVGFISFKKGE